MMKKIMHDAVYELSQVTWLTKKQAIRYSIITVSFVLISAIAFWAVDLAFSQWFQLLTH